MWKQTKTPNLDPVIYQGGKPLYDWLGWCLAYVQTAFGAGWSGSTAWDGWSNRTSGKHADWNIPKGVYVPIWFDGYWQGNRYGHVAIYKDGVVWSSPYKSKPYADKLGSIQEVERIYGMKYVGWSEFVGPTRVIEFVNNNVTLEQLKGLYLEILERPVDNDAIVHYVGKRTYDFTRNDLLQSQERKNLLAAKEAARKAAEEAAKKAVEDAAKKAEELRLAALEAEKQKEVERLAEEARKAQAEADRLAEEERKKKEEQAQKAPSWEELAKEQQKTNSLLQQIIDFIKRIFNIGG